MGEIEVLLAENDSYWRGDLVKEIRRACAEARVNVVMSSGESQEFPPLAQHPGTDLPARIIRIWLAETYDQAERLLNSQRAWKLVVTDIGLTKSDSDKFGKQVVRHAEERGEPCLVVSGSNVVGTDDVAELFRDYRIYDYFNKQRFDTKRFQGHVRSILDSSFPGHRSSVGSGSVQTAPANMLEPREVTIGFGDECFELHSAGYRNFSIPKKYTALFACFARKVYLHAAGEEVDLTELNQAVGEEESSKASGRLRTAISTLNESLCDPTKFGPTPNGDSWIINSRGSGYVLNTAHLRWAVDVEKLRHLGRSSQSVFPLFLDPSTLQANTPDDD